MPCNMSRYPLNWKDVRKKVLLRAGGQAADPRLGAKCEFCGVQNYAVGFRDDDGQFQYARGNIYWDDLQYATSYADAREAADHCNEWCDQDPRYIVIVLTVAHLEDPNPANVSLENLAALCQRCHNRYDNRMRVRNAAKTHKERLIKSGQLEMWQFAEE